MKLCKPKRLWNFVVRILIWIIGYVYPRLWLLFFCAFSQLNLIDLIRLGEFSCFFPVGNQCNLLKWKSFSCTQENEFVEQTASNICAVDSESNEIHRFEQLRNELIELEKRVQRSTGPSENEEVLRIPWNV